MHTFFSKVFYRVLLITGVSTFSNSLMAIPQHTLSENDMKLAMLDFNRQGFKLSTPLVPSFPNNCLEWNAWQIDQKAKQFNQIINKNSHQYKVDKNLIKSVITAESCFRVKALSHAGAQGLMQLIPDTAKRFGVKNSYIPEQNIRGGTKYLRFLLDRYKGNLKKVIAAYNAGEGKIDQYKGIPPYKETQRYVKNVLKIYSLLTPKPQSKKTSNVATRTKAIYRPPKLGQKPGRHGWQYNRKLAPHLYKQ